MLILDVKIAQMEDFNILYCNMILYFLQEKAAQTLDFIMSVVGRLESDKHSLALKEIVALTSR